ncbi:hypothetical protein DXG03_003399 [Asterophora parasitica]|uniref:DH domain-containing protein n=1 Tax=Asterophora parasitica TaxID=117018 RepID=A0A9P7K9F8_9AGAR|nr:hypothetical protein DXG03_003399 [Asterophora parasitica]
MSPTEAIDTSDDGIRSRRMGMANPPSSFPFDFQEKVDSPVPISPPIPVRSPLRPISRSISGSSTMSAPAASTSRHQRFRRPTTPPPLDIEDYAAIIVEELVPTTFQMRHRSFPTHPSLSIDDSHNTGDKPIRKSLPPRPESPILSLEDEATTSSSSSSLAPPMTKRQHALHELLSSERAYASDLALMREVHIPLALGYHVPLNFISPSTPPPLSSSSSSSRTLSMSSDSSSASLGPPMTQEDTRTIFSNIAELAMFSDQFCDGLEEALGAHVEGGEGEDHVGALFLEIVPEMEKPYKYYINRHPGALAHLQALPQTPALAAYLKQTQTVASSLSHAWDLASLLIKPVQRLLKYPLLLAAIIDETPDTHTDKENLRLARTRMEEVARNVNEGRRRAEVVKEVLTAKKKPVNVGVAASVNLTKMKSLRHGKAGAAERDANGEAAQVAAMQEELKRIDVFAQQFARNVVDWARMMTNVVLALRTWAASFGKVIGLSPEQGSEAFDAFMGVVEAQLIPLCHQLEADVNERLLREIAHLLTTMNQPLKLLASMNEQEPFHFHLLTMNVSQKNRPPPALLAASTNYLALRGQLASELPTYLKLLHRGLAGFVLRLAQIQATFWADTRDRWADLWEMLRVEGEMNAGSEETVAVWHARWVDVVDVMAALNVTQEKKLYREPPPPKYTPSIQTSPALDARDPGFRRNSTVTSVLAALEPAHMMVSSPHALTPRVGRPRGQSDASPPMSSTTSLGGLSGHGSSNVNRKLSNDSFPSSASTVKPATLQKKKGGDGFMDFVSNLQPRHKSPGRESQRQPQEQGQMSPLPRTKSMPLPAATTPERSISHRSSASSKTLVNDDPDDDRGRTARQPSLRRYTESISSRQRSVSKSAPGSQKAFFEDYDAPASPPTQSQHYHQEQQQHPRSHRDSWATRRAKYTCKVMHPCKPPASISYFSFPFFTLVVDDLLEVLQETGHPSQHPKLPLYVDDGEDCLLLCRDGTGDVGWALASFLEPVDGLFGSG